MKQGKSTSMQATAEIAISTLPRCVTPRFPAIVRFADSGSARHVQRVLVSAALKQQLIGLLPRLRRFARTLTRSATEADDLVQEACLKALANAHQWDPAQPLDRWMFRITRNLWISEVRKRSVRLGQGHVPADESAELVSPDTGEGNLAATQIHHRIASLPDELSTVLLLVSVEGYSYAEAAEVLDIPLGTVMSRVHRARKALAGQLADAEGAVV